MIEFHNVSKVYHEGTSAVDSLSLTAPTGKITVLVGPSGCGKTTTLRMVNRLVEPTSGAILLGGEDSASIDRIQMRRRIGYVIQNAGLFPHQTVLDNICAVPYLNGVKPKEAHARAHELLALVGIDESYAKRYPWQLSGGQQQRVGVARALAADPPYMLMDEPFSAVDPIVRKQLQSEFLKIQSDLAKTILMVTHDIDEALRLGDQIVVMQEGGVVAQIGSPAEILARPANRFVAEFLGESRGYHALGFASVEGLTLHQTPAVAVDSPAPPTEEIWVVATDAQNRPLGWAQPDSLGATASNRGTSNGNYAGVKVDTDAGTGSRATSTVQVTVADVSAATPVSLSDGNRRELLDAALASPGGQAIVVADDGTYAGTVDLDDVIRAAIPADDASTAHVPVADAETER